MLNQCLKADFMDIEFSLHNDDVIKWLLFEKIFLNNIAGTSEIKFGFKKELKW